MNHADATREVLWNIQHAWIMYVLLVPTLAVAAYGIWLRVKSWRRGRAEDRFDRPAARLGRLLAYALLQTGTWRRAYGGTLHAMIFWGFIVLTIATTVVLIQHDFGLPIMHGNFYLYFQSLVVDVFGVLAIVGVGMAGARRWLLRPRQLVYTTEASAILIVILAILVSGFLIEGWRIAATDDPWGEWSPFGYLVALASRPLMSVDSMKTAHAVTWWTHLALVFAFLAWAPYTKMAHVLTSTANVYASRLAPIGANLRKVDFEESEKLGIHSLAGFTWKDLLDFDACTECGRCTAACPANRVGKQLSPRDIILDLQRLSRNASRDFAEPFIGAAPALSVEAMWECTTCAACVEACPVLIEQMPKIVDVRRYLVMEDAEFPETMQQALTSVETRGHPFRGTAFSRVDWLQGLDVPSVAEAKDADVLLWVGCGGALVERNQKVVRALAQLLARAGVKFAILGREEKCTGDPARRIGNEFLFETLAQENVATLNRHGVKEIVTSCPHCFNTLANEYPQYGGRYVVYHHSQYLAKLVEAGKLNPRAQTDKIVTFHDPCYLGRHNGEYDAPRQLVQISSKANVEMTESRNRSFCCGGGGGMSFVDEPPNQRVNQQRADQALATGAEVVAVGCPFCMTMLEDGINARKGQRDVKVMDVAEILWEAVEASAT